MHLVSLPEKEKKNGIHVVNKFPKNKQCFTDKCTCPELQLLQCDDKRYKSPKADSRCEMPDFRAHSCVCVAKAS